jgi:putative addiction module CopG family antidote
MTMKISLPEEFSAFVEAEVKGGHYATPDDVFRDALRLMEQHAKAKAESIAWLQQACREGIESGFVDGPLDFETIKAEGRMRREKSAR